MLETVSVNPSPHMVLADKEESKERVKVHSGSSPSRSHDLCYPCLSLCATHLCTRWTQTIRCKSSLPCPVVQAWESPASSGPRSPHAQKWGIWRRFSEVLTYSDLSSCLYALAAQYRPVCVKPMVFCCVCVCVCVCGLNCHALFTSLIKAVLLILKPQVNHHFECEYSLLLRHPGWSVTPSCTIYL